MKPKYYTVEETACWPNKFKISPVNLPGECWKKSNSGTEYFPLQSLADEEIIRRGAEIYNPNR
jgi:hypothetical protein